MKTQRYIGTNIPASMHDELRALMAENGWRQNQAVTILLREALAQRKRSPEIDGMRRVYDNLKGRKDCQRASQITVKTAMNEVLRNEVEKLAPKCLF